MPCGGVLVMRICSIVLGAFVMLAPTAHAEFLGKVDLEAAELAAELIGAPVFAADGPEIGQVADLLFDDNGQPARLRIETAAALGFGGRIIELPKGTFMVLRGAVSLDFPAEALQSIVPADQVDEK